jgi:vitamin B12 transporter
MCKSRVFSVVGAVVRTIALSVSAVAAIAAEGAGSPDSSDSVESVIVSATRLPTPESQVASSVTVITAEDIEARQQRSLPDILQDVPGTR